jgi:fluoroquinolone transport system permease protein
MRSLGPVDLRSIARDSMLRWFIVMLPVMALVFRFGVPAVRSWLLERLEFDLLPYYPLLMSCMGVIAPGFVGAIVGFLLLDQRDDQTLPALLVTPMSLGNYVAYRLSVPTAVSIALSILMYPLAGFMRVSPAPIVLGAVCAAPLAPLYALFMGTFARNKVQGLALCKALGILVPPAVAAYFVPMPWQVALGVVPHYWPLKVFWLFDEGAIATAWGFAAAGLAYQAALVAVLARLYARAVRG